MYKVSREEAALGAACPNAFLPLFMIRGKCACFRAKTVEISGYLPPGPDNILDCRSYHSSCGVSDLWFATQLVLTGQEIGQ
jgi:hypothetical protein